ncbi:hypothetical protein OHB12_34365 [Nocardia sp. NBC_01730]|uniref:hypothetical protein n=1 Tax=Nocardia sp. NBC_01730 TaxID=2975998 RepID=UPI002E14FCC8|nr:hypothetical protein OHB12_34365 [Nocardia sp. NBC_01730]
MDTIADPTQRPADFAIRLRSDLTIDIWHAALAHTCDGEKLTLPAADPRAAKGLKFSDVLPEKLAAATVSVRLADLAAARAALRENVLFRTPNG